MASGSLEALRAGLLASVLVAGLGAWPTWSAAAASDLGEAGTSSESRLRNCPDCPPNPLLLDCRQGQAAAGWILGSGEAAAFALAGWTKRLEVDATLAGAQAVIGLRWTAPDGTRSPRITYRVKKGEAFLPWASPAQVPAGYGVGELRCTWAE